MADYVITGPDGQKYRLTADNDAAIQHAVAQMFGGSSPDAEAAKRTGQDLAKSNYAAGLLDSVAKGQSFGLNDELGAATNAAFAPVSRAVLNAVGLRQPQPTDNDTFSQRYDQNLAMKRGFTQQFEKDNPKAAMAGNVAGGLITASALPIYPGAAPSLGGNMLRMGLTGAGYGGLQGFNEGEGGLEDRLIKGATGAAFGGAIGAAAPVVGAGVRAALETGPGQWVSRNVIAPVAQRVASVFEGPPPARSLSAAAPDGAAPGPLTAFAQSAANPTQQGMADRLAVAVQRSGMSREQAERKLAELGPEAMLADLDAQFRTQARTAYTMPGGTRSHADIVLPGREQGRPDRMIAAFEGGQPPPSTLSLTGEGKAFEENARQVGRSLYQGDMAGAGLQMSPELDSLLANNPTAKGALTNVMNSIAEASKGRPDFVPPSPVEIMHMVKQQLQGLGYDTMTGKPLPTQQVWREFADNFVNKLKAANPELAKADMAYAQAKSLPEHFDRGYNFLTTGRGEKSMNASSQALAEALATANQQQAAATRAGMVNAARDEVSGRNGLARSLALAKDVARSKEIPARIGQVFGPEQAADIGRKSAAEVTFDTTNRGVRGGPDTASKLADMFDSTGIRVSDGKPSLRWWETFKEIGNRLTAPNESVRDQIGRALLNPDTKENARILALAFDQLRNRQAGSALPVALAGNAQFGGP